MRILAGGVAAIVMAVFTTSASAALFTGMGDPSAVVSGSQIDFESGPGLGSYASLTYGNVTISGVGGNFRIDNSYAGDYNSTGGAYLDNNEGGTSQINFDFATAVSAFAFNWGAADVQWTLSAYDVGNALIESHLISPTHGSNALDYVGISAAGISHVTLTTTDQQYADWVFVDRFTSGDGGGVPEPATWALMLGGFGLAGAALRRRRSLALAA